MANIKYGIYGDLDKYKDIDEDEILKTLTEEELEQIAECFDPENESLPASERQKDQTKKTPTGPFDRQHLIEFLEKKAKEEKDWEDKVPYKAGEKRGKIYESKKTEPVKKTEENVKLDPEWENALEDASEEDLVNLAGILGLHGMLNQEQYEASQRNETLSDKQGRFQGIAKFSVPKPVQGNEKNNTDVEESLKRLKSNDATLKTLNLNNIVNMSIEQMKSICLAVETNKHLKELFMANTRLTDPVVKILAESIRKNNVLTSLNVESNFITQAGVNSIMQAMRENTSITELRIANQNCQMGQKLECEIANILESNSTLLKLGFAFEHAGPRVQAHDAILRNIEAVRKGRAENSN
ncbi:tropomodulin-2-like [Acanthaster planci]|uniref:Tropomodulin-2-like n=1 Tax=Acanthaster planci TaxID=133434 RepID=A0A8B7ZTQ6_ACAPL|nr:tropomodulin-2-like [Acanthaster planci]XP_022108191.1 tropomodulin-2-like [Acanthaster planci]